MEENKIIIHIPESESLSKANLSQAELEKMVKTMFDGKSGYGITGVIIKGGPQKEVSEDDPTWDKHEPGWDKSTWERDCE